MTTKPPLCRGCPLETRGSGFGVPDGGFAKEVMFVGEALGREEAETGTHFQGLAGWQLATLLARSGLSREDIFVENVIHCRPPQNKLSHAP